MSEMYLCINKNSFENSKISAIKRDKELNGKDSDSYTYDRLNFKQDEVLFKDGELTAYGDLSVCNDMDIMENLGFVSVAIKLSVEEIIPIVEHYLKQVNKMKTVLEALK